MIFVRGNHALQGLLTLGWLTFIFTNSHIILPSVWLCLCAAMLGIRNVRRKFSNTFKKVTGSSSSRSSSHRSSTPAPSVSLRDEQAESQALEEQAAQQEEEAPDDISDLHACPGVRTCGCTLVPPCFISCWLAVQCCSAQVAISRSSTAEPARIYS